MSEIDLQGLTDPDVKDGGKVTEVQFPEYSEDEARYYAQVETDLEGLKATDPAYNKRFKKHAYQYLKMGYFKSLTPSGEMGLNPSSEKIRKRFFDKLLGFLQNIFAKKPGGLDTVRAQRRFRSAIATLTHLLLKGKHGFQIKSRGGKISDFQFKVDGKGKLATIKNQYFRLLVASLMTLQLEELFTADQINLKKMEHLIPGYKDDLDDDQAYKLLNNDKTRDTFLDNIVKSYKSGQLVLCRAITITKSNPKTKKKTTKKSVRRVK